jgi:hypothetical protein
MGPTKQLAVIPFTGGLDTKSDPRLVTPGKLLQAQNVIFKQTGSLNRRWGYQALPAQNSGATTKPTKALALGQFNQQLLLFDGLYVQQYSPTFDSWEVASSAQALTSSAFAPNCTQKNKSIVRTSGQQISPDFATLGGIDVYVWEDQTNITGTPELNGIYLAIFETSTGNLLSNVHLDTSTTAIRPKAIAVPSANVIAIFWTNSADNKLYHTTLNPATQQTSGSGSLVTMGTPFFDVQTSPLVQPDGSNVIVLYSAATTNYATWQSFSYSTGLPVSATTTTLHANPVTKSSTGTLNITFDPGGTAFWCTYADNGTGSTSCSTVRYTSTYTQTFNPVQTITGGTQIMTVCAGTAPGAPGFLYIFAEQFNNVEATGIGNNQVVQQNLSSAGSVGTQSAFSGYGFGLASKLQFFNPGNGSYIPLLNLAFQSPFQSCYFSVLALTQQSGFMPCFVAQTPPGLGGGLVSNAADGPSGALGNSDNVLPEFVQVSPGVFKYANLVRGSGQFTQFGNLLSLTGVQQTKLDFTTPNLQSIEIAGSLYTAGGTVGQFDGSTFVENNFLLGPEGVVASAFSTTGGHMAPGVFYYCVVWSWQDSNGAVQYSSPSVAVSVTVPAGTSTNQVEIAFPALLATAKSNVQARIYRTAANGTTFTEVTTAQNACYLNGSFVTAGFCSFFDGYADASIASNGAMYTQPPLPGGTTAPPTLENTAPPPCTMMAPFDERLFVSGLDNPLAYAFSQQVVSGIPLQFNAALMTGLIDPDGGAITGIARLDSNLVFFKQTAIFYINGTGPDATGQNSAYSQPAFLPSGGVGCVNQNSIVLVPKGLMFQSLNGFYLLDRGLNVTYVGAPVEFYNNLVVTSATLLPNQWIVWTTTSGTAIVYDYFYDQWSTFTNHQAVAAILFNGLYYFAQANGTVMQQTPATFTDNGTVIGINVLTAKFALAQIQGYQRVYEAYLLGSYRGPGVTLTVGCAYDNEAEINAMAVVPVDNALGVTLVNSGFFGTEPWTGKDGSTVLQLRFDICKKCESIQFQISDSQNNPGYEGFSLSAITLNVGVKRGGNKGLPAAQQFGVK